MEILKLCPRVPGANPVVGLLVPVDEDKWTAIIDRIRLEWESVGAPVKVKRLSDQEVDRWGNV